MIFQRRLWRHAVSFAFALFLALPAARADDLSRTTAYKKMPWHLLDVSWELENDVENFEELAITIRLMGKLTPRIRLYIAPVGMIRLNDIPAYGGLQTRANKFEGHEGKQIIFSRWDERRREFIRPAPGATWRSAGTEGDFISIRQRMEWDEGAYRIVVRRAKEANDDADGTWVEFEACVVKDDACTTAGALKFPGRTLKLRKQIWTFVEIYGQPIDPEAIPHVFMTFGELKINGKPAKLKEAVAIYPTRVPQYINAFSPLPGAIEIELGKHFDHTNLPLHRGTTRKSVLFRSRPAAGEIPAPAIAPAN